MPHLRMSPEDARTLAVVMTHTFRDDRIPLEAPAVMAGDTARGAELFEALGCRGCHIQGGQGGYVGPGLFRTGVRLRSGWVYTLLREAGMLEPEVLHADYGLGEDGARALTAFLMAQRPEAAAAAEEAP